MSEQNGKIRARVLIDFSDVHRLTLMWISKIREGLQDGVAAEDISPFLLYYFDADLKFCFSQEENRVLNTLEDSSWVRQRALSQHEEIQDLIQQMRNNETDGVLLAKVADKLERHIKFEERELYNQMQLPSGIPGLVITSGGLLYNNGLFISMN